MTASTVEILKLCPQLMPDFLSFFENEAFADNPEMAFLFLSVPVR